MLIFTHQRGPEVHYVVSGRLSANQLAYYYDTLRRRYRTYGRLRLLVTVEEFRGYRGWRAVWLFLCHEPALIRWVRQAAFVVDSRRLGLLIRLITLLAVASRIKVFPAGGGGDAQTWLSKKNPTG